MSILQASPGWRVVHLTDRSIELRKSDVTYRRVLGRDGFVRIRGEPGMDRHALLDKAFTFAMRNDERLAEIVAKQLAPKRQTYEMRQRRFAPAFGTPEDPEVIGVKRG